MEAKSGKTSRGLEGDAASHVVHRSLHDVRRHSVLARHARSVLQDGCFDDERGRRAPPQQPAEGAAHLVEVGHVDGLGSGISDTLVYAPTRPAAAREPWTLELLVSTMISLRCSRCDQRSEKIARAFRTGLLERIGVQPNRQPAIANSIRNRRSPIYNGEGPGWRNWQTLGT